MKFLCYVFFLTTFIFAEYKFESSISNPPFSLNNIHPKSFHHVKYKQINSNKDIFIMLDDNSPWHVEEGCDDNWNENDIIIVTQTNYLERSKTQSIFKLINLTLDKTIYCNRARYDHILSPNGYLEVIDLDLSNNLVYLEDGSVFEVFEFFNDWKKAEYYGKIYLGINNEKSSDFTNILIRPTGFFPTLFYEDGYVKAKLIKID